jgi:hypothetical protein
MKDRNDRPVRGARARRGLSGKVVIHSAFVGFALAFFAFAVAHTLNDGSDAAGDVASAEATTTVASGTTTTTTNHRYVAVLDPSYSLGAPPAEFSRAASRGPRLQLASLTTQEPAHVAAPVEPMLAAPAVASTQPAAPLPLPRPETSLAVASVPMPMPRPAEAQSASNSGPSREDIAQSNKAVALATPAPEQDSIFKKLFGVFQSKGPTLAFAAPDGGVFSDGSSTTPGKYDRYTAVYDISARTVYLPNGSKLEAHSGLGELMDDPRFVDKRMRGATPPHLYDLTLREKPFHGVRAIRLNPIGGKEAIHGRTGLLAHTYLLGPRGDSNGCVSLKDYDAFLRAYESGTIKRLAVVAKLS